MRALTLHQPWASLVALGVKTVETRSWPAPKSLIGQRIAIHAGRVRPDMMHFPPLRDTRVPAERAAVDAHNHQTWFVCDTITDPAFHGPRLQGSRVPRRAQSPALFFPSSGPHARPRESGHKGTLILPLGAIVATAVLTDCVPMVRSQHHVPSAPELHLVGPHLYLATPDADPADITDQIPYGDFSPGRWAWLLDDIETDIECVTCAGSGTVAERHDYDTEWLGCQDCLGSGRYEFPISGVKGHPGVWTWAS